MEGLLSTGPTPSSFWAFRPIWLAISISSSSFWLLDTYFGSYFSWLAKSGCQNLKLAGNTFPPFPSFWSPSQSTQYTVHSTQYTFQSTHSTQNTVHSTQYTVHSTQYTVHSTQYTVHSTQYTAHSTQYTVHTTHYRVNMIQYTVHSTQYTA